MIQYNVTKEVYYPVREVRTDLMTFNSESEFHSWFDENQNGQYFRTVSYSVA